MAWRKLRLSASLYTLAQRDSSPHRTTKTIASLPLMSWRSTESITPSSTSGCSRLGIFMRLNIRYGPQTDRTGRGTANERRIRPGPSWAVAFRSPPSCFGRETWPGSRARNPGQRASAGPRHLGAVRLASFPRTQAVIEILQCLKKYGQRLDLEIAKETGVPLATVRQRLAGLAKSGQIITCNLTRFEGEKRIEAWQCRVSGYVPPPAPGRKTKAPR